MLFSLHHHRHHLPSFYYCLPNQKRIIPSLSYSCHCYTKQSSSSSEDFETTAEIWPRLRAVITEIGILGKEMQSKNMHGKENKKKKKEKQK